MLWQCHRKAMKLAANVTIHENSYIHADTMGNSRFSLPRKLSNSHKACSGHKRVLFLCPSVCALQIYVNNCPMSCDYMQCIYCCTLHYVFRVAIPPTIRSTYNCIYSIWHWS